MDKKINNFDFDFMPIGQAIKKAREAKKVTREQLAEIVDYSAATGKTKKQADASVYNRNQDSFTIENVIRWFDYWRERPGTGKRVSSGGARVHRSRQG